MPRYYHSTNYHHQKQFLSKTRRLVLFILVILIVAGLIMFIDSLRASEQSGTPSVPSQELSASFSSNSQIFRTQYFQFQTDSSWKQIDKETTTTRFVYRSFRGTLVEHELFIYINEAAVPVESNYVLPVEVGPNSQLVGGSISEHCKNALPKDAKTVTKIKMSGVEFLCNPDATDYTVNVGLKGGGAPMKLLRPEGGATYGILYRNVKANPDGEQLQDVISAFQIR